jgi:hypothetical protein
LFFSLSYQSERYSMGIWLRSHYIIDCWRYHQIHLTGVTMKHKHAELIKAWATSTNHELAQLKEVNATLLEALKEAQNITAYAAGGMAHAPWMTLLATLANETVRAAIAKAEGL